MKIYRERRRLTGADYPYDRHLLQGAVSAVIEGARDAGATEFLVDDSHGRVANLRSDELPPEPDTCRDVTSPSA
ncbi:M55 family metallopeptidase [Streptacidiphilus melanogenes]|uniref:M55 family metallopeptidase n=1 Tax=Streptacidiphilus melanogenes TaxID=411235 RepID=UPI0005A91EB9|nr:M55 family metallopeptidase [Streptacidiphilus melanogenes]